MYESDKRALVTSARYLPNIGGVENSLYYIAYALAERGYQVDILSSDANSFDDSILPAQEEVDDSIRIYRYRYHFRGRKSTVVGYLNSIVTHWRLSRSKRYAVVIARDRIHVLCCWLAGIRHVIYIPPGVVKYQATSRNITSTWSLLERAKRFIPFVWHRTADWLAVRAAERVYVFSNVMKKQVQEALNPTKRIDVTKPGVDVNRFCPPIADTKSVRESLGLPQDKIVVLGIGRFVAAKGFHLLIESLSHLSDEYVLCLVGAGPELPAYKDVEARNGLTGRVYYIPATAHPEKYYQSADIFVLSSTYEPLGQTVLEAQSAGLPVVAFKPQEPTVHTATEEIVTSTSGILVEDVKASSLASGIVSGIKSLKQNPTMKTDIRQHMLTYFTWKNMVDCLLSG